MTISLRERRKQETAGDIQRATLRLVIDHGMDNVTIEAIAKAAGVSARTFFNYFENKEAAAVGTPPGFPEDALDELLNSTAPLSVDIKRLLERHISILSEDLELLRMVRQVVHVYPTARSVLERFLNEQSTALARCLSERIGDRNVGNALAECAVRCNARAIILWENERGRTLFEALDIAWESQIAASRILASNND